jgi:hypothetical protein
MEKRMNPVYNLTLASKILPINTENTVSPGCTKTITGAGL